MKKFCLLIVALFCVSAIGCSEEPVPNPPVSVQPNLSTSPSVGKGSEQQQNVEWILENSEGPSSYLYLEQLRLALENTEVNNKWSLSKTVVLWSNLTVDLGPKFPTEQDAFNQVWQAWTEPVCVLTMKPDSEELQQFVKDLIQKAVASEKGNAQDSITYREFRIKGYCSMDDEYDNNFFRFSFMDEEVAAKRDK